MAIRRIKVSNFKSFEHLELDLRPLSIVVGSNAAGKSNFLEIFRFFRDLTVHGLEDAISLQGGMEYLTNLQIGTSAPLILEMRLDPPEGLVSELPVDYRLALRAAERRPGFEVIEERLIAYRDGDDVSIPLDSVEIAIFDLDPKLSKKAIPIAGRAELEPDGSNLAIVLRNVLQDEGKRKILVRLLKDSLPFLEDLKVDRADRSLLIVLKESYSGSYLPAPFLSDGTIHLAALILALYFEKAPITIIEEPERNIHPHLVSRLAEMLADASRGKQVIVTTHNPELVKHARLEDLLLVHRDADGFSRISRPAENEDLKVFLENDLGVDELYVQNLLGAGHGI